MKLYILGINIYPGQEVQIELVVEDHIVSDSFLELDLETRKCRTERELSDDESLFVTYTQKSCEFECSLRFAKEECGCIGWNYPRSDLDEDAYNATCYGKSARCFQKMMNDIAAQKVVVD